MKNSMLFITCLLGLGMLTSCGKNKVDVEALEAEGCTVSQLANGSEITCGDTTTFVPNGNDGMDGLNGADGAKGDAGKNGINGVNGQKGDKGDTGKTGATGQKGDKGDSGLNGQDGAKGDKGDVGEKGDKGDKGDKGVVVTTVKVKYNKCTQVDQNLWVENIHGDIYDVYSNANCRDSQGEYCDNVAPSFGSSGSIDKNHHEGSATVCWAKDVRVSGYLSDDNSGDMIIKVENFN